MRRSGKAADVPIGGDSKGSKNKISRASNKTRKTWLLAAVGTLAFLAIVAILATRLPSTPKQSTQPTASSSAKAERAKVNQTAKRETLQAQLVKMQAEIKHEKEERIGNKTYYPSFGIFPKDCKWRLVTTDGSKEAGYQFWDFSNKTWTDDRPSECTPTGYSAETAPEGWDFHNGTPRTEVGTMIWGLIYLHHEACMPHACACTPACAVGSHAVHVGSMLHEHAVHRMNATQLLSPPCFLCACTFMLAWTMHAPHATQVTCDESHCMYNNLYYNNGRWYALVDGATYVPVWRFSRNQEVGTIHVKDARNFTNSVRLSCCRTGVINKVDS